MELADMSQVVEIYRRLRKRIKELDEQHEENMKGRRTQLQQLSGILQNFLRETGGDSHKTKTGTFYQSTRWTASADDKEAFMNYVREADAFQLLDVRPNATSVRDHVAKYNATPPGVKLNAHVSIGVRAPKGQAAPGEKEEE